MLAIGGIILSVGGLALFRWGDTPRDAANYAAGGVFILALGLLLCAAALVEHYGG